MNIDIVYYNITYIEPIINGLIGSIDYLPTLQEEEKEVDFDRRDHIIESCKCVRWLVYCTTKKEIHYNIVMYVIIMLMILWWDNTFDVKISNMLYSYIINCCINEIGILLDKLPFLYQWLTCKFKRFRLRCNIFL